MTADRNRDAFFCAIGRFVFEFSQLEFTLGHHLAEALGLDDEHVDPVMSAFDFSKLCGVVEAVCSAGLSPELRKHLGTIISQCRKVNEERVRVVHGLWVVGPGFGSLHSLSRSSLKRSAYFEDPAEIDALSDRISQLRTEVTDVILSVSIAARRSI